MSERAKVIFLIAGWCMICALVGHVLGHEIGYPFLFGWVLGWLLVDWWRAEVAARKVEEEAEV